MVVETTVFHTTTLRIWIEILWYMCVDDSGILNGIGIHVGGRTKFINS